MADSFKDLLDKRKRTAIAIFHRFRLEVAGGLEHALFVEGFEDKAFYCKFLPLGNFDRDCIRISFGKRNMDRLIALYYAEGMQERCDARFVRDADFDDYLGTLPAGHNVIILDRYSVENYIFTIDNFSHFIEHRFGASPDEFDLSTYNQRYENCVQYLFTWMAPFIGAALEAMQDGEVLNLDGLPIRELTKKFLAAGFIPDLEDSAYESCSIPVKYRNENSQVIGTGFCSRNAFRWLRGHYLAQICSVLVQRTHDDLHALKAAGQIHTLAPGVSTDFSASALSERMGVWSSCPPPLLSLEA